jgi:hypothetical protein
MFPLGNHNNGCHNAMSSPCLRQWDTRNNNTIHATRLINVPSGSEVYATSPYSFAVTSVYNKYVDILYQANDKKLALSPLTLRHAQEKLCERKLPTHSSFPSAYTWQCMSKHPFGLHVPSDSADLTEQNTGEV